MKLLKDSLYLSKSQWRRLFLAMTIMVVALYTVAMIFSLCGSKYFILNYQNEQMDMIEAFMQERKIQPLISWWFDTLEFTIVSCFVIRKLPKWYYVLPFYGLAMIVSATIPSMPIIFYTLYIFAFHFIIPLIDQLVTTKIISGKIYLKQLLRLLIAIAIVYTLQVMIFVIKNGEWSFENHISNLSTHFVYAIEYDIALSVILFTAVLLFDKEKGDSNLWVTFHTHGLSSQTSMKQSQKSNPKKLSKTQKNKIRLLYARFYLTQLGAFLLLMVLPFFLGKVLEFLVMYLAFAVARFILGFKYSLHYKKEWLCVSVGAIVFGILSLAVPFFYVVLIVAVLLGVSLAIILHLSYKYKGMFLFNKIARPDKFAELYVLMDGNLDSHHVEIMCRHKGLNEEQIKITVLLAEGNKKSYIANQMGYEVKTIERRINEALDILNKNS